MKMDGRMIFILALCFSSVCMFPTEEKQDDKTPVITKDEVAEVQESDATHKTDSKMELVTQTPIVDEVSESVSENESQGNSSDVTPKPPRRTSSRKKNRRTKFESNSLAIRGKRPSRRRTSNSKKGSRKGTKTQPTKREYRARSNLTDQFNVAFDELLAELSDKIVKENISFHLKVANMPSNPTIHPWAYIKLKDKKDLENTTVPKKNVNSSTEQDVLKRQKRCLSLFCSADDDDDQDQDHLTENDEDLEAEEDSVTFVVITKGGDEVELVEADKAEDDVEETKTDDDAEVIEESIKIQDEVETAEDSTKNQEEAETVEETTKQVDEIETIGERKAQVDAEATEEPAKGQTEESDDDDDSGDDTKTEETIKPAVNLDNYLYTQNATLVYQPDGAVEFDLKLLSEEQVREGRKIVQDADDCSRKKSESKRGRGPSRRFPRRTNAVASGLEQIKRTDDVKVLDKSNSTRFIDIPMEIGPVVIRMKSSASYLVKKSRTTSSVLSVILRLKERDGNIVSAFFKPTKIQATDVRVTIWRKNDQKLPTKSQTANIVNHLSQEFARIWNSGFLLQGLGRKLKVIYNKNDQSLARNLIKNLKDSN